jgi:SAM-dependent methyltransferase
VQRFAGLIRPGGSVLDVACGSGRHLQWLAAQGFAVTGVDRDGQALAALAAAGSATELLVADLESQPWPLPGRRFDGIVITNYLWRPLFPSLRAALAAGGVYIHETFADGHQHIGRPARPDFLLQRGELLRACQGLRVVAYEDGFEAGAGVEAAADTGAGVGGGRCVQRIAAVHEAPAERGPVHHPLWPRGRGS